MHMRKFSRSIACSSWHLGSSHEVSDTCIRIQVQAPKFIPAVSYCKIMFPCWISNRRSLAEKHTSDADDPRNVILVGHSSGAQAALRYAELYPVHGIVLVSTYSDLGDAHERASGYYPQPNPKNEGGESNPYLFSDMKINCKHWHQFHSDDDPFIPLHEAERIRDGLGLSDTYHMLPGRSHYFDYSPELLDVILSLWWIKNKGWKKRIIDFLEMTSL